VIRTLLLTAAVAMLAFAGMAQAAGPAAEAARSEPKVIQATKVPEAPAKAPKAEAPKAAETPAESTTPAGEVIPASDAEFFAELGYKPVATASDAARVMVILVSEGKELGGTFAACKAYLDEHDVLPGGWLDKAGPDTPLTKGRLATLLCKALHVKGGLWMRLLGPVPRFALHECVYLELMVGGAEYAHVQGGELVGVVDRADRFRARGTEAEVPKLEGEPSGAEEAQP